MTENAVPAPRSPEPKLWPTRRAVAYVMAWRDITSEGARKWLTRHVTPLSRELGRNGENLWPIERVRQLLTEADEEFTRR